MSLDQVPTLKSVINLSKQMRHVLSRVSPIAKVAWKGSLLCMNSFMTSAMLATLEKPVTVSASVRTLGTSASGFLDDVHLDGHLCEH